MESRTNRRNCKESFLSGRHVKLEDLKEEHGASGNSYLFKTVPASPRPEIHVSHLRHDTDRQGLEGVRKDGGFRAQNFLQWWSLSVRPEDIVSAETRLLDSTYPDRIRDHAGPGSSFLGQFASSPSFLGTSRYGSYRFTFPVEAVLEAYSQQFCSGAAPVLQVYETVLFKQEVMYVVLVDSPAHQSHPLLLDEPGAVCAFRDGRFLWRPEAMSETHWYELIQRPSENQLEAKLLNSGTYYVWDHVAIALHMEPGQVLNFDPGQLRENLTFCDHGRPVIAHFEDFADAQEIVNSLWLDFPAPLEKERSLQRSLSPETDLSRSTHSFQ